VAEEQVLYPILVQLELGAQVAVLLIQQAVMQELQVKVFQVVMLPLTEAVAEAEEQVKQVKDLILLLQHPPLNMVGMAEMV
jgi:hypothetical protein